MPLAGGAADKYHDLWTISRMADVPNLFTSSPQAKRAKGGVSARRGWSARIPSGEASEGELDAGCAERRGS
jgi:hypothetical protein